MLKFLKTLTIFSFLSVAAFFITAPVQAGGGRITMNANDGVSNLQAAQVTATIYADDALSIPLAGQTGSITFENPVSGQGQSCTTIQGTSDAQGQIKASCNSLVSGEFHAKLILTSGDHDERSVAIHFNIGPQYLSGNYKMDVSDGSVNFANRTDGGYGVNAFLRDKQTNEAIFDQSSIEYVWSSNDESIVKFSSISNLCITPVNPPCPRVNAQLAGYKPGSTTIKVQAKKNGSVIAENTINVTVTQTTTGTSNYTAPVASPSPSPGTSLSPSASPKGTPSPTPAASMSASVADGIVPGRTSPVTTPSPIATTNAMTTDSIPSVGTQTTAKPAAHFPWEIILIVLGVGVGIAAPLGYYLIENNPEFKKKVLTLKNKVIKRPSVNTVSEHSEQEQTE